jgi:hypothetical protein
MIGKIPNGWSFFKTHLAPICVQLVGEHLGQRCSGALSHLGMGHNDCDAVVCAQFDPGMQECFMIRSNMLG